MAIAVGTKLPSAKLKTIKDSGIEEVELSDYLAGKNVALFAVPGAFTSTCSNVHLPGYLAKADEIKAKGADEIICMAVNDAAVLKAWGEAHEALGKITMLSDGNGAWTRELGLELDLGFALMGVRSKRFAMVIEDGVLKSLEVEDGPGVDGSGAEACLLKLS